MAVKVVKILVAVIVAITLLLFVALVVAGGRSQEVDLPPAKTDATGAPERLSWLSRAGLQAMLDFGVATGNRSGYIVLVARDGQIVHGTTAGWADIESGSPMTQQTRVRMASMTKPVTAVAAHILIEEGRLNLDDPVAMYIPAAASLRVATSEEPDASGEFPTEPLESPLLVKHLLMFTSGFGSQHGDSSLNKRWAAANIYSGLGELADRVERLMGLPLYEQPGTVWRYGWSADVLARVVEVAANEPFGDFVYSRILDPLGMQQTSFLPPPEEREGMASVYTQDEDQKLVKVEQFKNDAPDWTPGGSGLVSTASDYMRFALMLWNSGSYNGVQILKPETVANLTSLHVPDGVLADEGFDGLGWGLGLAVVADAESSAISDRNGDYWWSGYYGTTFFVSPSTGLVAVVLSQNEPGPHSDLPLMVYAAQSFLFMGL